MINTSSSYFEFGKLETRMDLLKNTSDGIIYVYCNNGGEQGYNSTCMDGASMVYIDKSPILIMTQFPTTHVEIETVTVDVERQKSVQNYQNYQDVPCFHMIDVEVNQIIRNIEPTQKLENYKLIDQYEQCIYAIIMWLWGYYSLSGATFLFLPLSGGLDSGLTSALVFAMCKNIIVEAFKNENIHILSVIIPRLLNTNAMLENTNLKHIINCYTIVMSDQLVIQRNIMFDLPIFTEEYLYQLAKEICNKIHITVYLASEYSSKETLNNAKYLSDETGATFLSETIIDEYNSFLNSSNYRPEFGNSVSQDIALECLQARCRMVKTYKLCQLYNNTHGYNKQSFGLVLAASNASELFTGYWTKYDAGSGDLCLIGGCSKPLVNTLGRIVANLFNLQSLKNITEAIPTAELKPSSYNQTDESDMGFTYKMNQLLSSLLTTSHLSITDIFHLMMQIYDNNSDKINISKSNFAEHVSNGLRKYTSKYFLNVHKRIISTQSVHIEKSDPDYKRASLMPNNVEPKLINVELLVETLFHKFSV